MPHPIPLTTHAPEPLNSSGGSTSTATSTTSGPFAVSDARREMSIELIEMDSIRRPQDTLKPKDASDQGLLEELKELAKKVCHDVESSSRDLDGSPGSTVDALNCFKVNPEGYDNPSISTDELWQDVLNGVLKNGLGWGTELDVRSLLDTNGSGLMGLVHFVEYFVVKRGVSDALFEGNLTHLMSGLRML